MFCRMEIFLVIHAYNNTKHLMELFLAQEFYSKDEFLKETTQIVYGLRCKLKVPVFTLPHSATEARNAYISVVIYYDYNPSKHVLSCDAKLRKSF